MMESKIYTVACVGSLAREARLIKEARRTAWLSGAIVGIIVGVVLVAVALESSNTTQTSRHQQMTSKLEIPYISTVPRLDTLRTKKAEQVAEPTPTLDVPLTAEEMTAMLETCEAGHIEIPVGLGLIQVESSFQSDALNPVSGCYGYCQLNPKYFPADLSPVDNIRAGIEYLAYQLERYDGNLGAALTAYNAGKDTGDRTYADKVIAAAATFEGVRF